MGLQATLFLKHQDSLVKWRAKYNGPQEREFDLNTSSDTSTDDDEEIPIAMTNAHCGGTGSASC